MKKEEIYVSVESKEQAEMFRKVLGAMGEPISTQYSPFSQGYQLRLSSAGNWLLGEEDNELSKITFGELIDLLQRKPLYKSNDGFDIFENDLVWIPQRKTEVGYDQPLQFKARNSWSKDQNMFVNKQAALEWIESQKPKEIVIDLDKNELSLEAHCNEKSVSIFYTGKSGNPIKFTRSCIDKIYKAMEELNNG